MQIKIDTKNKTIEVLESCTLRELYKYLGELSEEFLDYAFKINVINVTKEETSSKFIDFINKPIEPNPYKFEGYPPNKVTCVNNINHNSSITVTKVDSDNPPIVVSPKFNGTVDCSTFIDNDDWVTQSLIAMGR